MEISFEILPVYCDICPSKRSMGSYAKKYIVVGTTGNSNQFLSSFNLQTLGIAIQMKRNKEKLPRTIC